MSITLNELQVYKLKVSLFAHRWREKADMFGGDHGVIQSGSHCYLDQITKDGWALFHLFGEDCKGLYVMLPVSYADSEIEEVLDEDGKVMMMKEKT